MGFSLEVVTGPRQGQAIELEGPEILLGSAPVCQIVLSAPTVSRIHCRLAIEETGLSVHDQASTNGTFVSGQLVESHASLRAGELLRVGPFEFRVHFRDLRSVLGYEGPSGDGTGDTGELYQRAIEHDEEAARQLYYRFLPRITSLAERSLGSQLKRVVDAEDLAQEILVEALIDVAAYDFRKRGSFMAFLRHKLRHVICDQSRYWQAKKRSADQTVSLDAAGWEALGLPDKAILRPEAILSLDEQLDRMQQALSRLPQEDRRLIRWAKIEERPPDELAQELNLTRDALRMRVGRAVRQLQKEFDAMT